MLESETSAIAGRIVRSEEMPTTVPTVSFYVPTHEVSADAMPRAAGVYWEWIRACKDIDSWGPYDWTLRTYLLLHEAGVACEMCHTLPSSGIVVAHRDFFPDDCRPGPELLMVCIIADRLQPGLNGLHPFAQYALLQNPRDRMIAEPDPLWPASFMPFWPQPGLIPRDPNRGDIFQNVAYFGWPQNLQESLNESAWRRRLEELGLSWRIVPRWQWHDYSQIDAVVAIRSFSGRDFGYKPATKLYNAWHAGVPSIIGVESAFQAERRSDLDYIEAGSFEAAVDALRRLRDDVALRHAMVANGKQRAAESSAARLTQRWASFLAGEATHAWSRWRGLSANEQANFFDRRAAATEAIRAAAAEVAV
jgi:hypothetical protein